MTEDPRPFNGSTFPHIRPLPGTDLHLPEQWTRIIHLLSRAKF